MQGIRIGVFDEPPDSDYMELVPIELPEYLMQMLEIHSFWNPFAKPC